MWNAVGKRTTILGLVSWGVPFVVSFLFFDQTGKLMPPEPLFKSLMVVVFGALGCVLFVAPFRKIPPSLRTGLGIGCYWLVMNLLLDLLILVPMVHMAVQEYAFDIGIRYLLIPIIGATIGIVAERSGRASGPTR